MRCWWCSADGFHDAAERHVARWRCQCLRSLTVVRAVARVLRGLFPNSSPVRAVINSVSVLVWLGVVTHMAGVLPTIETELERAAADCARRRCRR